jgi:hypothetical protein
MTSVINYVGYVKIHYVYNHMHSISTKRKLIRKE